MSPLPSVSTLALSLAARALPGPAPRRRATVVYQRLQARRFLGEVILPRFAVCPAATSNETLSGEAVSFMVPDHRVRATSVVLYTSTKSVL